MRYTRDEFLHYINGQLDSINVAITRKARGSRVENAYFLEHWEKLRDFFIDAEVKEMPTGIEANNDMMKELLR